MRLRPWIALFLLALAGCGGSNAPHRLTIAVIPMGTTHEYWKAIHAGAVKAAREENVELVWKGPQKEDDRTQQIAVVEDMVSRRVNGIVLAPLDGTGLAKPVAEARRAGIPSVIVDSGLQGEDYISFIATDNYKGGRLGARRLAEILNGQGSVIMMRVMVGAESTMRREQGFLDEIRNFPGIRVLSDNQYGGITTETAYQTGENLLNRFPDVNGVFCPNESTTFGMLRALTDAGKAGKVKFVGFDSSEKLIAALRQKQLHGLVLQNPFRMGELGVKTVVRHIRDPHAPIEKRIDTGAVVATPENMDTPEIRQLLVPPVNQYL
ncbi:MAG: substrate-binding domain-containing protein [Acidobacteria bacterium]|nr:substrate-binding domain-containing protein [Acidobacteriota bacterium]